eukprot:Gb_36642 [translate_table: standard]
MCAAMALHPCEFAIVAGSRRHGCEAVECPPSNAFTYNVVGSSSFRASFGRVKPKFSLLRQRVGRIICQAATDCKASSKMDVNYNAGQDRLLKVSAFSLHFIPVSPLLILFLNSS